MKSLLFLILFFQLNAIAQNGKHVRIEFLADQDSFPDCRTLFYANGKYILPDQELLEIDIPNTIPVNPSELNWNNLMIFHSFSSEARKLGSIELDEIQLTPITLEEIESLIKASEDSLQSRRLRFDVDYLRTNYGILIEVPPLKPVIFDTLERKYSNSPIVVPRSGIIDGVFIDERKFVRVRQLDDVGIAAGFYHRSYLKGRISIQPKLDSIFQPFYFSNYEVTNGQYREFMRWVADSIELHMAYSNLPGNDALLLVNCSNKERKSLDTIQKNKNLARFGLTRANQKKINKENWAKATTNLYFPQPLRYYKRPEKDHRQFIYKQSETQFVSIYPDTSGFYDEQLGQSLAFIGRMSWHPFYENYPVTNVTYEQIQAFCHWKQRQMNEELKSDGYKINVRIPTITEYEFVLKKSLGTPSYHLALDQKNDHFIHFNRPPAQEKEALFYTAVDYNPWDKVKSKLHTSYEFMLNYKQWYQTNQSESPVKFLNGNVSEFVLDEVTPERWKHYRLDQSYPKTNAHFVLGSNYKTDIKTFSDDQYNAIFYKTALENGKSSPLIGFRLVYLVEKL